MRTVFLIIEVENKKNCISGQPFCEKRFMQCIRGICTKDACFDSDVTVQGKCTLSDCNCCKYLIRLEFIRIINRISELVALLKVDKY